MFGWFNRKKNSGLYPESLWTVELIPEGIRGTDNTGKSMTVGFGELRTVAIATNDSGPWGADVWWLMYGADGELSCAFPQGATGEKEVLDYLLALPGLDHGEGDQGYGKHVGGNVPSLEQGRIDWWRLSHRRHPGLDPGSALFLRLQR